MIWCLRCWRSKMGGVHIPFVLFSLLFPFFLMTFFFLHIDIFDILAILHRYFDKILLKCERNYRHRYFPILSSILSIFIRYVHGYVPKYPWFKKIEISSIFPRYYRYFRLCLHSQRACHVLSSIKIDQLIVNCMVVVNF